MNEIVYNKLVRDRIPEIIELSGKKSDFRTLNKKEYLEKLEAKLDEEVSEFHKDHNLEELADVLEVVYSLTEAYGNSLEELERVRVEKVLKRGGFKKKIFLKRVYE